MKLDNCQIIDSFVAFWSLSNCMCSNDSTFIQHKMCQVNAIAFIRSFHTHEITLCECTNDHIHFRLCFPNARALARLYADCKEKLHRWNCRKRNGFLFQLDIKYHTKRTFDAIDLYVYSIDLTLKKSIKFENFVFLTRRAIFFSGKSNAVSYFFSS